MTGSNKTPGWHPEGDALFHSLQVFAHARAEALDPELWAAALFHDVGKGLGGHHDAEGAAMLLGLLPDRVVWLVAHHLDLLKEPGPTRRKLRGTDRLRDLEQLRRWDLAGRDPRARVGTIESAVDAVLEVALRVRR